MVLVAPVFLNAVLIQNFCLLIVCAIAASGGRQNVSVFSKKMKNIKDKTGFAQQHLSRSAINCAASCQENPQCQTFSFDKKTKVRKLGNDSHESERMYRKQDNMIECPEEKGYTLWIYAEAAYCLKFYTATLEHSAALNICNGDGGQLALIDSPYTRLTFLNITNKLGVAGYNDWLWFDGYDFGDQDKFMSWKGEELPASEWLTDKNQPENRNGEDCIMAGQYELFKLRDAFCTGYPHQLFCQIEQ